MPQTVQINFTGGIVSPGYLKEVLNIAAAARITHVRFGLRQQLLLSVLENAFTGFAQACAEKNIVFYRGSNAAPNIMSSYPAAGIFTSDTWLREGVYKDVFDAFDFVPKLKINICDSTQNFVPFYTGHINWISSKNEQFWHLYIRFPGTQVIYRFPELIYTNDLTPLSKIIEALLLAPNTFASDTTQLYHAVRSNAAFVSRPSNDALPEANFALPYYEGFNRHDHALWLGIYRRDEMYPLSFLTDMCDVCLQTRIGQLYTTPWKSIIIKGIDVADRRYWDGVLGTYRINVRHAANELNWQVEDGEEEGLLLKRLLIRHFDKEDVRTYGLCFAVQVRPHQGMFGSIIIRKEAVINPGKLKSLERFEILYTKDFNPNSFQLVSFRQQVQKEFIATYLVSVCKLFYEQQHRQLLLVKEKALLSTIESVGEAVNSNTVYQCSRCFTVYEEAVGDPEAGIAPGTPFTQLSADYTCYVCGASKEVYKPVQSAIIYNSLEVAME